VTKENVKESITIIKTHWISRREERRSEMNIVLEDSFGDNFGEWTNRTFVIWV
ncbi:unnamed protein product, partial [Tenebrio molitor]